MVALGFLLVLYLAAKNSKRKDKQVIYNLGFYALLGTIIGGRAAFIFVNWDFYSIHLADILKLWEGGMMFYGGFLLAIVFMTIYAQIKKIDFLYYADILVTYLGLGIFLSRIGCLLNGCCFGLETSLPWAMRFPMAPDMAPRHPTQMYMALAGLILFFILYYSKNLFKGFKFYLFLALYSFFQFFIEFFRYYETASYYIFAFTLSQWISVGIFMISMYLILRKVIK